MSTAVSVYHRRVAGSGFENDDERTAIEVAPPNHTLELETSELKEMAQAGVAVPAPNLTVGLLTTDLVEVKPGKPIDPDAKVEVATELIPRAPLLPAVPPSPRTPPLASAPTELLDRLTPAQAKRGRMLVIAIYFLATLALGLAILSRL